MTKKDIDKDNAGFAEKFLQKMYKNYGNTVTGKILIAFIWILIAPFLIFATALISLDLFYAPYKLTREIFFIVNDYDLELLKSYNSNTKYNLNYFQGWQYWIDLITNDKSLINVFLFLFILFFLDNRKEILKIFYITFEYIYNKNYYAKFNSFLNELKCTANDITIRKRDLKRKPRLFLKGIYCLTFGFCYIFLIKLIPIPRLELVDILTSILNWLK